MYALINYLGSICDFFCDFFSLLLVFSDPADFDVLEQFGTNKGVSIKSFLFCKGESIKSFNFWPIGCHNVQYTTCYSILISEFNNKVIHIV